jgi:anhydro-N-acetylmuramic acid kinase
MSGTSLDGVDAVLANFDALGKPTVIARAASAFEPALRETLFSLNTSGPDELARAALAANSLAALYAKLVAQTLEQAKLSSAQISAIGAHGQTVRHQPRLGYTIQLNAPALLAELTGIAVVADFRSRDVAAGGQGAPLVPVFHAGIFSTDYTRIILNLGGIANITILRPGADPLGFDTGPANALMDSWCQLHTQQSFDADGAWGAQGCINQALLNRLSEAEPWLTLPPPKSTGRDLFNLEWLEPRLQYCLGRLEPGASLTPQDVQATLCAFTAATAARAINTYASDAQEVLLCGGGANNSALRKDLQAALPCVVTTTDIAGVGTQDVEALAFAWLAWAHQHGIAVGNPKVTGARGARILGATWPA